MKRLRLAVLALSLLTVLSAIMVACEKSNAVVEQEQAQENALACVKGCMKATNGCEIKGNISTGGSKFYHLPRTQNYDAIKIQPEKGERWFCTEADASASGFRRKDY